MWKIVSILCSILLINVFSSESNKSEKTRSFSQPVCKGKKILISEKSYNKHTARIARSENHTCQFIDLYYEGKIIFHEEGIGAHFYFGPQLEDDANPFFYITKSDYPEFIFANWNGGVHCCYTMKILRLKSEKVETLLATDPSNFVPEIEDIDGDNTFEIKVLDDIFAYVFSSFAYSAKGRVIFRYINDQYQVSPEDTERANPTQPLTLVQLKTWQYLFKKSDHGDFPPPSFVQAMTDLFYSGNSEAAFELTEAVWPADIPGKEKFLNNYIKVLSESSYYSKLSESF